MEFVEIVNSGIHPIQNLPILNAVEKLKGDKVKWAQDVIVKGFETLESKLKWTYTNPESVKFCCGDTVTMADVFVIPQMFNADRFKVDMSRFPFLNTLRTNCMKLE
eukprot:CAMPEP_0116893584 /NCGR_PEP_ID=MMETSP0467-20121206/3533_1 /TAXON_ID=283647 /ORGANISM="Mesodinium pulex, Strain SPMC105" /LENGTH=105 /DNA_ID=CAMNT_0004563311 /DNA_START=212 /DNA_END=526 /DNA_ORIENTATION=+